MTVSLSKMFRVFGRIGILSFGGPAAQISLMQTELVDRHKWLTETQFLQALSFCMLLPGPEAMQLATYAGWKLRGVPGGLLAGLLFVLPGAAVIFALAFGYAYFGQLPLVQVLFAGIKAAVVIIVFQALYKLSRRALKGGLAYALALAAFVGIFFLSVPFPAIIALAAAIGLVFAPSNSPETKASTPVYPGNTLRTVLLWGAIWAAPLVILWAVNASLLLQIGLFFSKLAVVTFGGAYAVLAYMTQEIVQSYGWLSTDQMIDALGLAETTPGPLILVTQFAGFMAGFLQGGPGLATVAALVTLWVTFVPCFLWIFAAAPYVESLLSRPRLKGAFDAISASVAGVILNLAVWFTLHVLFTEISQGRYGPVLLLENLSPQNAVLVALASFLYLVMRVPMVAGLLIMALLAWGVDLLI
ncbi:chromate efflux transporter [Roseovarius atlanticus]|uniref:chromate efflux transporter n=1 Tax=Roseovarius atlanticus TaxID=1641875 RepID=UPI001C94C0C3|nr:chromate efflux transporter [Roseovarius atlanticus]MBY5988605.1 chromate efflux transporter [Roseovarius atlanticus]MBY6123995.1 chromate efflux transporter [Roseovarius atlanticus]MBY6148490.1 chromate efflux transporter [Roseovarius atlanticus]